MKKTTKSSSTEKTTTSKSTTKTKTRSEHLSKLLALREGKKKKVNQQGKSDGLSTSTKKRPAKEVAPAKPKKKKKKKAPYSKKELKELKSVLLEERERLLRDLRQLDDIADSNRETTHATFSSHQADAASDSSALESTFIQRRYEEERFAAVSEALIRLENGTYGMCDFCADTEAGQCGTCPFIPVERLRAKPFARMCVELKKEMEKKSRR